MSSIYTPTATSHGSFVLPSDGDPAVAESVNDAFRDLADNSLVALTNAAAALVLAGQAVNGTTGGTYAPSSAITIGGSGLSVTGVFGVSGTSTFTGAVVLTNTVEFGGAVSFGAPVTFVAAASVQFDGSVLATASVQVQGNFSAIGPVTTIGNSIVDLFNVNATTEFSQAVTFGAQATFDSTVLFNNNVVFDDDVVLGTAAGDSISVAGTMTLQSRLRFSDTGRVPYRVPTLLPDASASVAVADGDVFIIRPGVTGARTYNLSTTGAVSGDKLIFASAVDQGLDNGISIVGQQSVTFSAADRIVYAEFIYLEGMADRADGWWPLVRTEKSP